MTVVAPASRGSARPWLGLSAAQILLALLAVLVAALRARAAGRRPRKLLRFRGRRPKAGEVVGVLKEVNIFPFKSGAALSASGSVRVDRNGLHMDRVVMVVNKSDLPITQRMFPCLALIQAQVLAGETGLRLLAPAGAGEEPLDLDLTVASDPARRRTKIDLHGLKGDCVEFGQEASDWVDRVLSKLSGRKVSGHRLVCIAEGESRRVHFSAARLLMQDSRGFDGALLADLAPLSLASEASLAALNDEIAATARDSGRPPPSSLTPMDRFRPNLVLQVDRELAFLEDTAELIQVGDVVLRNMGPTFRCVIPSVDQATGEAGFRSDVRRAEPLATLKQVRPGGIRFGLTGLLFPMALGGSKSLAPVFGTYMGLSDEHAKAQISPGDEVRILKYKSGTGLIGRLLYDLAAWLGLEHAG